MRGDLHAGVAIALCNCATAPRALRELSPAGSGFARGDCQDRRGSFQSVWSLNSFIPGFTRAAGRLAFCPAESLTPSSSNPALRSWGEQESPEVLLPKIFALWSELFVPLVYRGRFFLNPQMSNDPFFCEMEFR